LERPVKKKSYVWCERVSEVECEGGEREEERGISFMEGIRSEEAAPFFLKLLYKHIVDSN